MFFNMVGGNAEGGAGTAGEVLKRHVRGAACGTIEDSSFRFCDGGCRREVAREGTDPQSFLRLLKILRKNFPASG